MRHLFDSFVEGLLDRSVQNPRVFERHVQRRMAHQSLQGGLAYTVVQERDGKGVAETVRGQPADPHLAPDVANDFADVGATLPWSAMVREEIIVDLFPAFFLPGLQDGQALGCEGNDPVFQSFPFVDVEFPLALDLDDIRHLQGSQLCGTNAGMKECDHNRSLFEQCTVVTVGQYIAQFVI
jgi:hypothetical protein